ncbi:uncharacterized protein LOC114302390 [Camellia sinensis]|uniref:uncharacterized protein LOC114302390 n=1 Tax=Camellia sinensis TaxID=4442 RepID=UPI0010360F42|nr:uncharacterized protein LOC114302390 [Camellia sinensis]
MKDLGALSYFLGLEISQDSSGYFLTQAKYTSDLLARARLSDCKTVTTPVDPQNRLTPLDDPLLSDATLYRQLVGSLVYLTVTRADIAYAVHIVSQFMTAPRSPHYAALVCILRYLKGTLFHGLHYSRLSSLQLQAFSDADWAGDPIDRRSTTGFCFFLDNSLISWRSKKQTLVARSSIEAEYRALADTTQELVWFRWLLSDMGVSHSAATNLYCDNQITFVSILLSALGSNLLLEGAEATVDVTTDKIQHLKAALDRLKQPFKQFVAEQSPDWILTDFVYHWMVDAAQECYVSPP